jgi:hypothetical protein
MKLRVGRLITGIVALPFPAEDTLYGGHPDSIDHGIFYL